MKNITVDKYYSAFVKQISIVLYTVCFIWNIMYIKQNLIPIN